MFVAERRQPPRGLNGEAVIGVHAQEINSRLIAMSDISPDVHFEERGKAGNEGESWRTKLEAKKNEAEPGATVVGIDIQLRRQMRLKCLRREREVQKEDIGPLLEPGHG